MSVRVKICGITDLEDARGAERAGADAIGFVFHPESPRYATPRDARLISRELSPLIARVGVFVNRSERLIFDMVRRCGLSAVQLSGDEPPDFLSGAPFPVIRAVRVARREDLRRLAAYPRGTTVLLDSSVPGLYGGSGVPFDWGLFGDGAAARRFIIAGGLTPDNVGQAVRLLRPLGVDVSSGVEKSPGIKDDNKVRRFVREAKRYGETIHDEIP